MSSVSHNRVRSIITPFIEYAVQWGRRVYSATKAAVRSFARTRANEPRDRRIRVNALGPGHIDTPILENLQQVDAVTAMKEGFAKGVPLGRMGQPDEIARVVSSLPTRRSTCLD